VFSLETPETHPSAYYVYHPSKPSTSSNCPGTSTHYELPNQASRRPLPQPNESYVYMELDDPILSITTETSSEEFGNPDSPDNVGDYIKKLRDNVGDIENQSKV